MPSILTFRRQAGRSLWGRDKPDLHCDIQASQGYTLRPSLRKRKRKKIRMTYIGGKQWIQNHRELASGQNAGLCLPARNRRRRTKYKAFGRKAKELGARGVVHMSTYVRIWALPPVLKKQKIPTHRLSCPVDSGEATQTYQVVLSSTMLQRPDVCWSQGTQGNCCGEDRDNSVLLAHIAVLTGKGVL